MLIKTTKLNAKERRYQSNYGRATERNLYEAYGSFSKKKADAWEYCQKKCYDNDGRRLRVISHNSFIFTAGFEFTNPETGVIAICIITPSEDFAFEADGDYMPK